MAPNSYSDFVDAQTNLGRTLAPLFVDDVLLNHLSQPKPSVAEIVAAAGKQSDAVRVVRLANRGDADGSALRPEDIIDRTGQADAPIYLKCFEKGVVLVPNRSTNSIQPSDVGLVSETPEDRIGPPGPPLVNRESSEPANPAKTDRSRQET